jgi:hypothetical protein
MVARCGNPSLEYSQVVLPLAFAPAAQVLLSVSRPLVLNTSLLYVVGDLRSPPGFVEYFAELSVYSCTGL